VDKGKKLNRILNLAAAIKNNPGIGAQELATLTDVDVRTIYRYIQELRQQGYDVRSSPGAGGGYTLMNDAPLPPVNFTPSEAVALLLAGKTLDEARLMPDSADIKGALAKVQDTLSDTSRERSSSVVTNVSVLLPGVQTPNPWSNHLNELLTHLVRGETVKITYRSMSQGTDEIRTVDPYHIFHMDGSWYLAAFCHEHNEVRTFRANRVLKVERAGRTFGKPADFDINAYLGDAWRIARGESVDIVIRFSPEYASYIREGVWHHSQELSDAPDGGVMLKLHVPVTLEIKRFVLGFGPQAEVLQPVALREEIAEALAVAAGQYV
jgi:predicted DNA-binding transcriptional regulator YafY